jgi:succinylglutamate desuccinylase
MNFDFWHSEASMQIIDTVSHQIEVFQQWTNINDPSRSGVAIEQLGDYEFAILPNSTSARSSTKKYAGAISAIIHGNEVGGLAALNEIMRSLVHGTLQITRPLAVFLGNPQAALLGKRYIEKDLNRSFASAGENLHEENRAKILEGILSDCELYLDVHQVTEKSETPFFIYPFSKVGYWLSRSIAPNIPIVTRIGKSFSKEGMCSDEYVNSRGGRGITVELGQNGFDPFMVGVGVQVMLGFVRCIEQGFGLNTLIKMHDWNHNADVLTWNEVIDYPIDGEIEVVSGLYNFGWVEPGAEIARVNNGDSIQMKQGGYVLFPQYRRDRSLPRPKELIRGLKVLSEHDLKEYFDSAV